MLIVDLLNFGGLLVDIGVPGLESLEESCWAAGDVEIGLVIESVEVESVGGDLSDELETEVASRLAVILGGSGGLLGSVLDDLAHDSASGLFEVDALQHPWVVLNLLDSWSLGWVIAEHLEDQIFEFLGEALAADLVPVLLELALEDQVVEVLVLLGFLEWEDTLHDNEEDDAGGEHIDLLSVVGLALLDFWSHVGHGASVGIELVDFLVGGEAEVRDLEVQVIVDEDVLELKISVDDALGLHVTDDLAHLGEEEPTILFAHASDGLAEIEEETSGDVLEEDVDEVVDLSSGWLFDVSIRTVAKDIDDVIVLQAL